MQDPVVLETDDIELLLQIYDQDSDPRGAESAFNVFYSRHAEFLRCACLHYGFSHASIPAEGVANQVLAKVFMRTVSDFQPEAGITEPSVMCRKIRCWLVSLAQFTFFDLRKEMSNKAEVLFFEPGPDAPVEPSVTHPAYEGDEPPPPLPPERAAVLAIRDALSEGDRLLLDRSVDYYDRLSGDCKVPPAVARGLAHELGVTVAAVRQRRKRLFDRIRAQLEELPPR